MPSPTDNHQDVAGLLRQWLRTHAPTSQYRAVQGVGVGVSFNSSREPDVLLLDAQAKRGRHFFPPEQVALVVEVVSPGTKMTDRLGKAAEYAAEGIQHYWRVELDPVVHVFAYRLGANNAYELAADSAEMLELDEPFPIKLPISEIIW